MDAVSFYEILKDQLQMQELTPEQRDIAEYLSLIHICEVIPYWKGRTQRERIFNHVPKECI